MIMETIINIPTTMLIGILLVILAFHLALPVSQLSSSIARGTLGIALACMLLSFMMMITRSKAVPQVIGFLSMENGLFFAATAATYGMPMVVELGIALDVLVGILSSQEYIVNHGGTMSGFIKGLYHDLLHRTASTAEEIGRAHV